MISKLLVALIGTSLAPLVSCGSTPPKEPTRYQELVSIMPVDVNQDNPEKLPPPSIDWITKSLVPTDILTVISLNEGSASALGPLVSLALSGKSYYLESIVARYTNSCRVEVQGLPKKVMVLIGCGARISAHFVVTGAHVRISSLEDLQAAVKARSVSGTFRFELFGLSELPHDVELIATPPENMTLEAETLGQAMRTVMRVFDKLQHGFDKLARDPQMYAYRIPDKYPMSEIGALSDAIEDARPTVHFFDNYESEYRCSTPVTLE